MNQYYRKPGVILNPTLAMKTFREGTGVDPYDYRVDFLLLLNGADRGLLINEASAYGIDTATWWHDYSQVTLSFVSDKLPRQTFTLPEHARHWLEELQKGPMSFYRFMEVAHGYFG